MSNSKKDASKEAKSRLLPKHGNVFWLKGFAVVAVTALFILGGFVVLFSHPQGSGPLSTSVPATSSNSVTITVWGSGSPGGEQHVFNSTLAYFEAQYPNITVQDSPAINVASTNFASAAHAGNAPDVYRDTSDNAGALYASGSVLNLSSYLNQSFVNSFTTGTIKDWTLNGALYGVPVNTNGVGLYYNMKLVKTPPKTVYQMLQDAANVTKNTTSTTNTSVWGMPYGLGTNYGYRAAAWFPAFGGQIFNSQEVPVLNSSQDTSAVSFLYNLTYVKNVSPKGLTSMAQEQQLFETNRSAFIIDGPWDQSLYTSYLGSNLNVTALPYDNATGHYPAPIWGSIGYFITSPQASGITSSQIWASLKFIQFETNLTAQKNLFKKAGDFPSLKAAGAFAANQTASDPLAAGWIAQEAHTQIQPNFPQMNFYWSNFHTYVGNLYDNGTHNVSSVMQAFQNAVVSQINQETATPAAPVNWTLYGGIIAAVVIVAGVGAFFYTSRKKKN